MPHGTRQKTYYRYAIQKIEWTFEKRDVWIGVYWDKKWDIGYDVYICFVPCFPIHIKIRLAERRKHREN
jgi:hypothetical protein